MFSNGREGDQRNGLNEILQQLNERFIPFWAALKDERGGFFGGYKDGVVNRDSNKGAIMHFECLWFFSRAYQITRNQELKSLADHAYTFILSTMYDKGYGGFYYAVRSDGIAIDRTKHAAVVAAALSAFTAYFDVAKDYTALKYAYECFNSLEVRYKREVGYHEQFDACFVPTANTKMCDGNGTRHTKTMLRMLEAYIDFYVKTRDEKVKDAIQYIYELLKFCVYDEKAGSLDVYLDDKLYSEFDIYDVGINMNGSWVMTNAALTLGNFTRDDVTLIKRLVETGLTVGWDNGAMINRKYGKKIDSDRLAWVQAESVIAFLNAYNLTKGDTYLEHAKILWDYIKNELAVAGGWYYGKSKEGKLLDKPIAGPEYGPLQAGRMFLEVLRRGINIGL